MSIGQRPDKQSLTKYTDVLQFGKFKGHTVEYVLKREPSYLMWLDENAITDVSEDIWLDAVSRENDFRWDDEERDDGIDIYDFMAD